MNLQHKLPGNNNSIPPGNFTYIFLYVLIHSKE